MTTVTIDLNVVLDVIQKREHHYAASAAVLSRVVERRVVGVLPGHALTTIHYIVERFAGREKAGELVDWLLAHFEVAQAGKTELIYARKLGFSDFEDAVVAACAVRSGSNFIITRNISDFKGSPVQAVTPEEFLANEEGEAGTE
ncbi:MAG: PIN domain nuclease [Deferrisomatales bacterium]